MKSRQAGRVRASGKRAASGSGQMELPGIDDPPRGRRLKPPAEISGFGLAASPSEAVPGDPPGDRDAGTPSSRT